MIARIWRRRRSDRQAGAGLDVLCRAVEAQMETLLRLVDEEAALVRAGSLAAADRVKKRKARCADAFVAALEAVKRVRPALAANSPAVLERLQRRHSEFRSLLQLSVGALEAAREAADNLAEKPLPAKRRRMPILPAAPSARFLAARASY